MKINKKIFAPILSIVGILAMGVGTTYALFTSGDRTDISIQTGQVKVALSLDNLELYTPKLIKADASGLEDATNIATTTKFGNGGTATISGNDLYLNNIAPGDKAEFDVIVTNSSNIDIKYKTLIETFDDNGLFSGLVVTIDGKVFNGARSAGWLLKTDTTPVTHHVVVELPIARGNEYQTKSCGVRFKLDAVQANAYVTDGVIELEKVNAKLAQTAQVNETPFAAIQEVKTFTGDDAYDFPVVAGYTYGWNRKLDQFVLMNNDQNTGKDLNLYMFVSNVTQWPNYSHYLVDDTLEGGITINTGLDVGENANITNINYVNNVEERNVLIRTSTFATTLNVTAPKDTVYHYGYSAIVNVISIANNSFHEEGISGRVKVEEGHAVISDKAEVFCLMETGDNATTEIKEQAIVHDGAEIAETPHEEPIADCGADNHTYSKLVVDSQHVYDVCKKCGYTLINVRLQEEGSAIETEIKQTRNTVTTDPVDPTKQVVKEAITPVETYHTAAQTPVQPVDPETPSKQNYVITESDPVVPTPVVDPDTHKEGERHEHVFIYPQAGIVYAGHTGVCSCGLEYAEAHDSANILEDACLKCGYLHTHSYKETVHQSTAGSYLNVSSFACEDCAEYIDDATAVAKGAHCGLSFSNDDETLYALSNDHPITNLTHWAGDSATEGKYGKTIKILHDLSDDLAEACMNNGGDVTFDLNGKSLVSSNGTDDFGSDYGGANAGILWFQGDNKTGSVTFKDSSIGKSGKVENTCSDKVYAAAISIGARAHNVINIDSGTFNGAKQAIYMEKGTVTINGGTFTGESAIQMYTYGGSLKSRNEVTINGGTFNGKISLENQTVVSPTEEQTTHMTINAGTFNGKFEVGKNIDLVINAGKFKDSTVDRYLVDGKILVEDDGYFVVKDSSSAPTENIKAIANSKTYYIDSDANVALQVAKSGDTVRLLTSATFARVLNEGEELTILAEEPVTYVAPTAAEGFALKVEDVEGGKKYSTSELKPVYIGEVGYDTLDEALNVGLGKTIKLMKNIVSNTTIIVPQNSISATTTMTLDLNGKTISYGGTTKLTKGLIRVLNYARQKIDIKSSLYSTFIITDSSAAKTGKIICSNGSAIVAYTGEGNYGALRIEGGYIESATRYAVEFNYGPVTITGGTFKGKMGAIKNWLASASGLHANRKSVLSGGTFYNDISGEFDSYSNFALASGKKLGNNGDGTWSVVDA